MKRILIAASLGLGAILAQHHITDYRSAPLFRCDAAKESTFTPPYVPFIDAFLFSERLEVYVGGWIERGTLEEIGSDVAEQVDEETAVEAGIQTGLTRLEPTVRERLQER